ncbi:mRNA capping enzyme, catalytic domain-containing protein, variant 1 [Batrachochytrium dendrobatidis JEL423]|uniref:mRNA guanylyltransferase n=1 Tax=Batrachochytrium dendrobatidis (strain JEL423) TaxID=403673 RepID=A0A177WR74_BATDL|nr:mRNA capping enzyme, catalytic domain-containing protein, variant 1 [Batrachochytrium dendrobatidis JEL423]
MVEDYFVSEKADGVRCMMFTTTLQDGQVESYLIDRKNEYYLLEFGMWRKGFNDMHFDTVLDGELVFETKKDRSGQESRELWFLLFDAMVVDGKNLCDRPYTKRLGYLREFVLIPHLEYLKRNPNQKHNYPFEIVQKHLELSYKVQKVFDMMSKCHHKTDGVIYTSSIAPYVSGTCSKMLKWKPSEENTVDFKILDMKLDGSYPLFRIGILENRNQYSDFGIITLSEETSKEWAKNPPVGRIIECRYDPNWPLNWRFSRFRDDKDSANHISTYNSIMISINDNVQKDDVSVLVVIAYAKSTTHLKINFEYCLHFYLNG